MYAIRSYYAETSNESKYYATTYMQPVQANQANTFQINGVTKGSFGEGKLRISFGRADNLSKKPVVLFNGIALNVPDNVAGESQMYRRITSYNVCYTKLLRIVLYPNPATHTLSILGVENSVQYKIYTLVGTEMASGSGPKINISALPSGEYIVKLLTTHSVVIKQFAKK